MSGWIKLHRKLKDWEWYDEHNTLVLFIHLLVSVNHKDRTWKGVKIPAGSMLTGRKSLSKETGLSEQQIRTALANLQSTSEITIKSTNRYSIISMVSWESYQSNQPAERLESNNQSTTNKNDKENKEYKDNKSDNSDHAIEIVNHLNKMTNQNFRPVESNLKLINQRLRSGATVDEIKTVINKKFSEWKGTDMEKYLRPKTLFNATNFEQYIGEKPKSGMNQPTEYKGPRI